MNKLKTNTWLRKNVFLNFILPLFLMISVVIIIGVGCTPEDNPDKQAYIEFSYDKEYFTIFAEAKIHNMVNIATVEWNFRDDEGTLNDENLDKHLATSNFTYSAQGNYIIKIIVVGKDRFNDNIILQHDEEVTIEYGY